VAAAVSRPIAVVGPTGTGKSALALDLAERLGGEIVNADAMQLYRGMDIGTAKLPPDQRRGIPHHQLDVLDVTETATVGRYQGAASADVEAIMARGAVPVIVGGSMLYVQSLLDDWAFPATDPVARARWESRLAEIGVAALHAELAAVDSDAAASILPTDGRRIVRALEVVEVTGQPFAASAPVIGEPRWGTVIIGLDWETTSLDERLRLRTDLMFDDGLVDEVRMLMSRGLREGVTASRALGYAQVLTALAAGGDPDAMTEARDRTFMGTRRYVRRQRSWFRRDHRIGWLDGSGSSLADEVVRRWHGAPPPVQPHVF
jgi:tRNA dimethylallyltransferase